MIHKFCISLKNYVKIITLFIHTRTEIPISPLKDASGLPPALPPKRSRTSSVKSASSPPPTSPPPPVRHQPTPTEVDIELKKPAEPMEESNPLEELDVSKYLVIKKADEEGPDVRGGHPDALIIHATKANKNGKCMLVLVDLKKSMM